MRFVVLVEDSKNDETLLSAHGLSLYITTHGRNILLDTGPDDSFILNAQSLDIDLRDVDFVVLSHFHDDHSGGLKHFLKINEKAKIYIGKSAFDEYYELSRGQLNFYGLDAKEYDLKRFIPVKDETDINEGIKVISGLNYSGDNSLNIKFYKKLGDNFVKDDFSHELALVIDEGKKKVLFSGCFHSGVVNAAEKANRQGKKITHAVGGFHLSSSSGDKVHQGYFESLVDFLSSNSIKSYTGHCTGKYYYNQLKKELKDSVYPLDTGLEYYI